MYNLSNNVLITTLNNKIVKYEISEEAKEVLKYYYKLQAND